MSTTEIWKTAAEVQDCARGMGNDLAELLKARGIADPLMVGIHTGGVWVARCLHEQLAFPEPLGQLDISFYRDDFTRIGMHPEVHPSRLPVPVDDRHIVLVDDVLQTGRTIRAALNVLFDYGRPASVLLAILAERDGRELPIEPDVVGLRARLQPGDQVKLAGPDPLQLMLGQIPPERRKGGRLSGAVLMSIANIQLDAGGNLKHFLSIEGLSHELLTEILDKTAGFLGVAKQAVKKVPLCRGKTVANLFFESSTRTRTTFELAAKRLSADVLNLNIPTSSTAKGETLLDTLRNLEAMHVDMFVVRHAESGAAHFIAEHANPHVSVINAGDGRHSHPTQGMLDMFTIRQHKGDFAGLCVAVVGDILHSRVARSQLLALNTLGTGEVRVIAPRTLVPAQATEALGARVFHDLREGVRDADVIIMLRLQRERMRGGMLPSEHEYFQLFGLTEERLSTAKPDAIVMHPGPINRGVEMDSQVADGKRSVILEQVSNGIAVRMAVISMCIGTQNLREHGAARD